MTHPTSRVTGTVAFTQVRFIIRFRWPGRCRAVAVAGADGRVVVAEHSQCVAVLERAYSVLWLCWFECRRLVPLAEFVLSGCRVVLLNVCVWWCVWHEAGVAGDWANAMVCAEMCARVWCCWLWRAPCGPASWGPSLGTRPCVWWRQARAGQACEGIEQGVAKAAGGEHTLVLLEKRV